MVANPFAFNPFAGVQNWWHFNVEGLFDGRDMTRRFGKGLPKVLKQLDKGAAKVETAVVKKTPEVVKFAKDYPALAVGATAALAAFTPIGRTVTGSLISGGVSGVTKGTLGGIGGQNEQSIDSEATFGGVRREASAKPRKTRKAVAHARRPQKTKAKKRKAVTRKAKVVKPKKRDK